MSGPCSRWLKPGGQYLAVNYLIPDEDGPPFGTTREEQWKRFSPHFDLVKDWVPRSYPNRTGLERMFWWRRKRPERSGHGGCDVPARATAGEDGCQPSARFIGSLCRGLGADGAARPATSEQCQNAAREMRVENPSARD